MLAITYKKTEPNTLTDTEQKPHTKEKEKKIQFQEDVQIIFFNSNDPPELIKLIAPIYDKELNCITVHDNNVNIDTNPTFYPILKQRSNDVSIYILNFTFFS